MKNCIVKWCWAGVVVATTACGCQTSGLADEVLRQTPNDFFEVYADGTLPRRELATSPAAGAPGAVTGTEPVARQPEGVLSGRVIYTGAGHGWTYANNRTAALSGWYTQRGVTQEMNEDYGNLDQMNLFVDLAFSAGATVVAMRPIGYQTNEVVLDNESPQVRFQGAWAESRSTIFYGPAGAVPYRFAPVSNQESALATYTPDIPQAGFYPVYTWVRHGSDRIRQLYRIHHTGGSSEVRVPHTMVGNGWVYLGSYWFEAGEHLETGSVDISNLEAGPGEGRVVIADAIRFGNGMGDVVPTPKGTETPTISSYPREEECARYWIQHSLGQGQPATLYDGPGDDGGDNVGAPIRMAREMNNESWETNLFRRVYISFHSNAGGGRGTLGLFNNGEKFPGTATPHQFRLAQLLGREVNESFTRPAPAWLEVPWFDRGTNITYARSDYAFGEIRNDVLGGEMDATILEAGFHDEAADARLLRDPRVRQRLARATLQGFVRYLHEFDGVPLEFPPEPPQQVRARVHGSGEIEVAWEPTAETARHVVSLSTDGKGFGRPVVVEAGRKALRLPGLAAGRDTYFRVASLTSAGESLPSAVVGVGMGGRGEGKKSQVLVVNAFSRFDRYQAPRQTLEPGRYQPPGGSGAMERIIPGRMNSLAYTPAYGQALQARGIAFDSCDAAAVQEQRVALTDYEAVFWAGGNQPDEPFGSDALQSALSNYRQVGGNLFVSGAGGGSSNTVEKPFLPQQLHASPGGSPEKGTFRFVPAAGSIFSGTSTGLFDDGSFGIYQVLQPQVLLPAGPGSAVALVYDGGNQPAAIQYDGPDGGGRVVYWGFPFESIPGASERIDYMKNILRFFNLPSPLTVLSPAVVWNGGLLRFSWSATVGKRYQAQWKNNRDDTLWRNEGAVLLASGPEAVLDVKESGSRFYRIIEVE